MKKAFHYSKFLSILALVIILSAFLPQISQSKLQFSAMNQTEKDAITEQDEITIPIEVDENIIDTNLRADSINISTAVYGYSLRITNDKLMTAEYDITLGPNGTTHCIWFQQITNLGLSLMYSYSNDSVNWIVPEVIFRLYTSVELPQLLIDPEGVIHIVFYASRTDHYRLYYFSSPSYNLNFSNELIYDSLLYEIDELALVLTHNDTVNVVWRAETDSST
ncbi:MAG: hypothetical protein ACTSQK_11655, partial [Candidatus Heimdallarchaeota archaeon]